METKGLTEIAPKNLDKEQVEMLARRASRLIASVFLPDVSNRITLTKLFEQIEGASEEVRDVGFTKFIHELLDLMALTAEGMDARLKASSEEAHNAIAAREEAMAQASVATKAKDMKAIPIIEGLLRTSEQSDRIAQGIFAPLRQNLENVVTTGRQASFVQDLRKKVEEQECDNPNCTNCSPSAKSDGPTIQ